MSTTVQVDNVAPTVALNAVTAIVENAVATLTGTVIDPGTGDTFTVDIDWGDDSGVETFTLDASATGSTPGSQTFTLTHRYLDDNPTATASDSYTITATVTDDDTGKGSMSTTVQVDNVAPVVALLSTSAIAFGEAVPGKTITVSGVFVDQGTLDTHNVTIDWDDGNSSNSITTPGDFSQLSVGGGGSGSFNGAHQYTTGGIFKVVARVEDDDALFATKTIEAFVTGTRIDPTTGDLQIVGAIGADTITFTSQNTRVEAGDGANTITGTSGNNLVNAGSGVDTITLTSGNNTINAGGGANTITATSGVNIITTGDGVDTITLTTGNNTINAGGGANTITATTGVNIITTGDGVDTITVGAGGNTIIAGGGANTVTTGAGNDTVITGDGVDTIVTGAGDDEVHGGNGTNTITTGAGNDTVFSGVDTDTLTTGAGDDKIHITGGTDTIAAGAGADTLFVDYSVTTGNIITSALAGTYGAGYAGNISGLGIATFAGVEAFNITSGAGNDRITTGDHNDVVRSGGGNDVINLSGGDDEAVYTMSENTSAANVFQGGHGLDTLTLELTNDEWLSTAVQSDIANYLAFQVTQVNPTNGEAAPGVFAFTAFDLTVSEFETVEVFIDGHAVDDIRTALADNEPLSDGAGSAALFSNSVGAADTFMNSAEPQVLNVTRGIHVMPVAGDSEFPLPEQSTLAPGGDISDAFTVQPFIVGDKSIIPTGNTLQTNNAEQPQAYVPLMTDVDHDEDRLQGSDVGVSFSDTPWSGATDASEVSFFDTDSGVFVKAKQTVLEEEEEDEFLIYMDME
jgi:Ca2+-binding RTX toxin-like protein